MSVEYIQYDGSGEQTGAIINEPNLEYHKHLAISSTQIKDIERPKLFEQKHVTKVIPREYKKHFDIGDATHKLILEGQEAYDAHVCISKDLNFVGKDNKLYAVQALNSNLFNPLDEDEIAEIAKMKKDDIYELFSKHPGKLAIEKSEDDLIKRMCESVYNCEDAATLLNVGDPEMVFRTPELTCGFQIQAKTDWINFGRDYTEPSYIADLKTVDNIEKFYKDIEKLKYYYSAGYYLECVRLITDVIIDDFFWIVVEKKPPYETVVFKLSVKDRNLAVREVESDLDTLQDYMTNGFPRLCDAGIQEIELKHWAHNEVNKKIGSRA